jgi:hypothetical protein
VSAQLEPVADPPVYTITAAEFRMRCVAGWIEQYRLALGYAPSMREVGAYMGASSSNTVLRLLAEMNERGFVWWEEGRSRTTATVEGPPLGTVPRRQYDQRLCDWIQSRRLGPPLSDREHPTRDGSPSGLPSHQPHGTRGRYCRGCRCADCTAANLQGARLLKGRTPTRHGTESAYRNYACRCEPCRRAGSIANARTNQRRKQRLR